MADPYTVVDPVLIPWAEKHDLEIEKKDRGDYVRSIWLYGDHGRAQMWLHLPKTDNAVVVKVLVAELDPSRPTKWGRREAQSALDSWGAVVAEFERSQLLPIRDFRLRRLLKPVNF